jgi:signal transduction histidine kinase
LGLIFVPLFRASNARAYSGQGIGLPLVERIIHLHEGSIEVQSDPATGTVVRVRLKV